MGHRAGKDRGRVVDGEAVFENLLTPGRAQYGWRFWTPQNVGRLFFVANKLLAPQNVGRLFFVAIKLFTPQNVGRIFLVTRLKLHQICDFHNVNKHLVGFNFFFCCSRNSWRRTLDSCHQDFLTGHHGPINLEGALSTLLTAAVLATLQFLPCTKIALLFWCQKIARYPKFFVDFRLSNFYPTRH